MLLRVSGDGDDSRNFLIHMTLHISCCRRPCLWMSGNCLFLVNAEEKHLDYLVGHLLALTANLSFLQC